MTHIFNKITKKSEKKIEKEITQLENLLYDLDLEYSISFDEDVLRRIENTEKRIIKKSKTIELKIYSMFDSDNLY